MLWALIINTALAATAPEGTPFPEVPYLHHSMIRAKAKAEAAYPEGVTESEKYIRHRCMVWVKIDTSGAPATLTILDEYPGEACTAPFRAAAKAAVAQRTWKPAKIDKQKAEVHTQIAVVFRAQQAPPLVDVSLEGSPPPAPVPQPKRTLTGQPKPGSDMPAMPKPSPAPSPAVPVPDVVAPAPVETPTWVPPEDVPVEVTEPEMPVPMQPDVETPSTVEPEIEMPEVVEPEVVGPAIEIPAEVEAAVPEVPEYVVPEPGPVPVPQ